MLAGVHPTHAAQACRASPPFRGRSPVGQVVVAHEHLGLLAQAGGACLLALDGLGGHAAHSEALHAGGKRAGQSVVALEAADAAARLDGRIDPIAGLP